MTPTRLPTIRWTQDLRRRRGSGVEPPLKIVADETKNSLLIMANDRDYQRVLRVIQGLDVVASQVLIEAVIAEVTLNDQLQYGVQWQLSKGGTPTASFSNALTGGVAAAIPRLQLRRQTLPASRQP